MTNGSGNQFVEIDYGYVSTGFINGAMDSAIREIKRKLDLANYDYNAKVTPVLNKHVMNLLIDMTGGSLTNWLKVNYLKGLGARRTMSLAFVKYLTGKIGVSEFRSALKVEIKKAEDLKKNRDDRCDVILTDKSYGTSEFNNLVNLIDDSFTTCCKVLAATGPLLLGQLLISFRLEGL